MWEPVGPLPATVYWRRRWAAIGSAALVIVLLAWGVAALATGGSPDEDASARPAGHAAVSAPQQASPSPAVTPLAAPQPGTEEPGTPAQPATSTAPGPAPDPVPCTDDMLAVTAEVDRPEHRVGERTLLRLVVTNTSEQPCVRDLDAARVEIAVWSGDGTKGLWSSDDCSTAKGKDLRTLVPGQPETSTVRWAGRTSAPGCPTKRETVPAGKYRLLTRVDGVVSAPTPFTRTP